MAPLHTSAQHLLPHGLYLAGQWEQGGDPTPLPVLDKYHGTVLAHAPQADRSQMDRAIAAAHAARGALRQWSAGQRSHALDQLADALKANEEALAHLIMQEAGKPIAYARVEVERAVATVRTAAAEALRFGGEVVPLDHGAGTGRTAFTKRIPIGVVAAITPFNFPLNLVLHKVAPALAVGCPVVLKPAPQAPLTALALARLLDQLHLPAGAVSVLPCAVPVAEQLVKDERVAMLSFTGSDTVGWHLKTLCGKKKVALELGGNAAVIVDEGVDLANTARQVATGAFLYAGQICISTQRIFAVDAVFDRFRDLLVEEVRKIPCGDPADPWTIVGPIIDKGHLDRITTWVEQAKAGGATVLTGGHVLDETHHVYAPTLLTGTSNAMKVHCAEAFGPVATLERVKDFGAAIAAVNDSTYGLQAGVFTDHLPHVKRAHDELEVGGVIINGVPGFRVDSMPYGGIKHSGLGREGVHYAMEEMSEPRLLVY